ncbi:unnamed protein product [Calypogeia fissa]
MMVDKRVPVEIRAPASHSTPMGLPANPPALVMISVQHGSVLQQPVNVKDKAGNGGLGRAGLGSPRITGRTGSSGRTGNPGSLIFVEIGALHLALRSALVFRPSAPNDSGRLPLS